VVADAAMIVVMVVVVVMFMVVIVTCVAVVVSVRGAVGVVVEATHANLPSASLRRYCRLGRVRR
jgi:hypothetical protein